MLDELAQSLSDRVNAQQALGVDQDGNPGVPLFTPVVATEGAAYAMRVVISNPRELAAASATSDNGNALAMAALRDENFVNTGYFANATMTGRDGHVIEALPHAPVERWCRALGRGGST